MTQTQEYMLMQAKPLGELRLMTLGHAVHMPGQRAQISRGQLKTCKGSESRGMADSPCQLGTLHGDAEQTPPGSPNITRRPLGP